MYRNHIEIAFHAIRALINIGKWEPYFVTDNTVSSNIGCGFHLHTIDVGVGSVYS